MGSCLVSLAKPRVLMSQAVSEGIMNPVHETYTIRSMSRTPSPEWSSAPKTTCGTRRLASAS